MRQNLHLSSEFLAMPTPEVEASLASPPTRSRERELVAYFGSAELLELRRLAVKARAVPISKGRVLIVPGIQGSKLGTRRAKPLPPDVAWIGPGVVTGKLRELSLDKQPRLHGPLGVFEFVYLRCKLHLRAQGFDAQFFAYDWRDSLHACATKLASEIAQSEQPTAIVAHSMGGLIARAAMRDTSLKVSRCVLVGTPHEGAVAAVLALMGKYGLVDWLARLDLVHTSDELARDVWASFPSVYELLPREWTLQALQRIGAPARADLLARAHEAHASLAPGDSRMHVLAGDGVRTPVALQRTDKLFVEKLSVGDGTVPVASARLAGVASTTVLKGVTHTALMRDVRAIDAITRALQGNAARKLARRAVKGQSVKPMAGVIANQSGSCLTSGVLSPTYLIVRATRTPTHRLLRASLLFPRAGASVPAGGALLSHEQFREIMQADAVSKRPAGVAKLGAGLAQHALPEVVRNALARLAGPLVLVLDREASALPWETLRLSQAHPPLSHQQQMTRVLESASLEEETRSRDVGETRTALVIANPTSDLVNASREGERVCSILQAQGVQTTLLQGAEATHARVQAALRACPTLVHYAGHAHFDSASPHRSGLQLADGLLTSQHLRESATKPKLVILNACESARTRKHANSQHSLPARGAGVSLAEAIIRSGVGSVVGTWWPVLDASALLMSEALYAKLFSHGVGEALRSARIVLANHSNANLAADSVNYVLYGQTHRVGAEAVGNDPWASDVRRPKGRNERNFAA